ncbi:hypothetical protein AB0A74_23705 [Saccharothrix sp. NPDC042600]|uniref:hypothetical protein n=1 Tax=Saccharothrix TaxID=2071 RepID=UPI003406D279|nr:hypothetical protein GCM10017745_69840 [Saccharothrix mutabilis subsp. capreolus]
MTTDLLTQINHDVWEPFRRAYAGLDARAFLAVHGPDLIRAGGPARQVRGHAEYTDDITEFFGRVAAAGDRLAIVLRFTERLASADAASERGVFRIDAVKAGEPRTVFGHFHVFCRRTDRWRIVVDYEPAGTATEEEFAAAVAEDDVAAFG